MSQIICDDVSLGYGGVKIAEHLNFTVEKGDYLCIVGENGAGKSTLVKTVLGLQKPLSGEIRFSDGLKQGEIGFLPQKTAVQSDFPATAREIVLSGCLGKMGVKPFYSRSEKALADKNMERLGITSLSKRSFRELSGGQQQRVLLARAICAAEKLLLLDEPVAGLDPKATNDMYATIDSLHEDGITVIMVTHDISEAVKRASKILHVSHSAGFFGDIQSYLKSDAAGTFLNGKERE